LNSSLKDTKDLCRDRIADDFMGVGFGLALVWNAVLII